MLNPAFVSLEMLKTLSVGRLRKKADAPTVVGSEINVCNN